MLDAYYQGTGATQCSSMQCTALRYSGVYNYPKANKQNEYVLRQEERLLLFREAVGDAEDTTQQIKRKIPYVAGMEETRQGGT